ncbi:MAG: TonB-dependent receptor plug domain-containing protein, partial [Pseudomonadota bacterium]
MKKTNWQRQASWVAMMVGLSAGVQQAAHAKDSDDDTIIVQGTQLISDLDTSLLGRVDIAETPFSVNILTADLIDNLQARRLSDIIRRDPSVTVNTGVARFRN